MWTLLEDNILYEPACNFGCRVWSLRRRWTGEAWTRRRRPCSRWSCRTPARSRTGRAAAARSEMNGRVTSVSKNHGSDEFPSRLWCHIASALNDISNRRYYSYWACFDTSTARHQFLNVKSVVLHQCEGPVMILHSWIDRKRKKPSTRQDTNPIHLDEEECALPLNYHSRPN